ncbi:MAG TPA: DUF5050 domain-containing protein, partial [Bacteroidota bacterium]|nr:DUF5050 domain-containing protein [Bacteroidota bacterium]
MNSLTLLKKYAFFFSILFLNFSSADAQGSWFFYSFNADPWTFHRRNDDGTNPITVYTPSAYQISNAAVDGGINKVFFYESTSNKIFASNYDGSNRTTVLTASTAVTGIAVGDGYIFYAYLNAPYSVRRCNSDGTNDIQIYVNPSYGTVERIAFDPVNKYVYYYERLYDNANNRIFRTNEDGTNLTVIYNNCPGIKSFAAGGGYVYFGLNVDPWTFNRRNADGSSQLLIYTPPTGTVMECAYDATIGKIFFYDNLVSGGQVIYKADPDGSNRTSIYSGFTQLVNVLAAPTAGTVTFADGSGFAQSITPNSTNQVLGRFRLTGSSGGAMLTAASIKLNNVRTGLSNFKIWSSADASFGGDTQLGSTVAADPGDGGSVSFSGFSSPVSSSGTYFFLTGDVASGASGTVGAVMVQNASLTISNGMLSGTVANANLSNNSALLPVELSSFTASAQNKKIVLQWKTATEIQNYGFEVERRRKAGEWVAIGFAAGAGNSNSPHSYSFTDVTTVAHESYLYRLKQIDTDGK